MVHVRGLHLQQSFLSIMTEDLMDVVAGNVAFQNSRGLVVAGRAIVSKSKARVLVLMSRTTPSHGVTAV